MMPNRGFKEVYMSAKWKHLTWKQIAMMVLIVISGWILIGGIDCAPPDDSDLIIPLRDKPFEGDGNGWAMLSNVLEQKTVQYGGTMKNPSQRFEHQSTGVLY